MTPLWPSPESDRSYGCSCSGYTGVLTSDAMTRVDGRRCEADSRDVAGEVLRRVFSDIGDVGGQRVDQQPSACSCTGASAVAASNLADLRVWATKLERVVADRSDELHAAHEQTLFALCAALDARERESAGHSQRVAGLTLALALEMGLGEREGELEDLFRGAVLHDIGKIGIPDAVLLKAGELTDDERRLIESHVEIGMRILRPLQHLHAAFAIPAFHHERMNGSGYPAGLSGEEIPLSARIFSIIDVYDALRSERPYKAAYSHDRTMDHLRERSGVEFDGVVVDAFSRMNRDLLDELMSECSVSTTFHDAVAMCFRLRAGSGAGVNEGGA